MSQFIEIPLNRIKQADWNYKEDDESLMNLLVENIKLNGLIENIIVRQITDDSYEVVNGNHRLSALHSLKYKKAMCYNLGFIDLIEAKRIAIETNETHFESDKTKINSLMSELFEEFDKTDLEKTLLMAAMEIDPDSNLSPTGNHQVPETKPSVIEGEELKKIEFILDKKVLDDFTYLLSKLCESNQLNIDELNLNYSGAIELLIKKMSGN